MIKSTEYRLGQLCKRFSSGKGISADLISDQGDYPVIGGNGLRGYTDTFNFDGECAVIGRQGAYCGNVKFFSGKGYMTEHAVVTEPTDEHNAKYMTYKLGGLQLGRFSGQAAQPGLSVTKLARLRIEMPPKWYQDKVAFILSSYDNLIEVNNQRIKVLEQMAENLYKEWFVRFRFPGYETAEFENGLPKGWRNEKLKAIADFQYGKMLSQEHIVDNGYPIYTGYHTTGYYDSFLYEEPMLLVVARGVGGTGDVKISPPKAFITNLSIVFILKGSDLMKNYLYQLFQMQNLRFLDSGAAQSQITIGDLQRVRIIIPDNDILIKYNDLYQPISSEIHFLEEKNSNLIRQRDLLLPQLMSGRQEVQI